MRICGCGSRGCGTNGVCVVAVSSRAALDRAAVLLSMKREMVRLDNVWGVGGGLRPVKHLVKEVKPVQGGASLFPGFPSFPPSLSPTPDGHLKLLECQNNREVSDVWPRVSGPVCNDKDKFRRCVVISFTY